MEEQLLLQFVHWRLHETARHAGAALTPVVVLRNTS